MIAADILINPFIEFEFMQRALLGSISLAIGATPFGVLLILRRLSLTGDAIAHAILPGAAVGYLLMGMSLIAMAIGGFIAGVLVVLLSGYISRATPLREDASLAAFYLISLAIGVVIVSLRGSNVDLLHVLFGSILALDDTAIWLIAGVASLSLFAVAIFYRAWVIEAFDPDYLKLQPRLYRWIHSCFLVMCVLNLVSGFHAFGTLMAVGVMILPGIAARLWGRSVIGLMITSSLIAIFSCYVGLLLAFHLNLPAGPSVILIVGVLYVASLLSGTRGGLVRRVVPIKLTSVSSKL